MEPEDPNKQDGTSEQPDAQDTASTWGRILRNGAAIGGLIGGIVGAITLLDLYFPASIVPSVLVLILGISVTIFFLNRYEWFTCAKAIGVWVAIFLIALIFLSIRRVVVFGSLVDGDNLPLSQVEVTISDSSGVPHNMLTNEKGSYEIRDIPAGEFKLFALGYQLQSGEIPPGWNRLFGNRLNLGMLTFAISPTPTSTPTPTLTPTIMPTLTPTNTPTYTPTLTPTPVVINTSNWASYTDDKGSTLNQMSVSSELGPVLELSFDLIEDGWVGIFKVLEPASLMDTNQLRINYRGTGASNTIELKLLYPPNNENVSTTFRLIWNQATTTQDRITKEVPYTDFTCWEVFPCPENGQLNPKNIWKIDIAISNKSGDSPGLGTLQLSDVQALP